MNENEARLERLHDIFLDPDIEKPIYWCSECSGEIVDGQDYYEYDGEIYCSKDCLMDYIMEWAEERTASDEDLKERYSDD